MKLLNFTIVFGILAFIGPIWLMLVGPTNHTMELAHMIASFMPLTFIALPIFLVLLVTLGIRER